MRDSASIYRRLCEFRRYLEYHSERNSTRDYLRQIVELLSGAAWHLNLAYLADQPGELWAAHREYKKEKGTSPWLGWLLSNARKQETSVARFLERTHSLIPDVLTIMSVANSALRLAGAIETIRELVKGRDMEQGGIASLQLQNRRTVGECLRAAAEPNHSLAVVIALRDSYMHSEVPKKPQVHGEREVLDDLSVHEYLVACETVINQVIEDVVKIEGRFACPGS